MADLDRYENSVDDLGVDYYHNYRTRVTRLEPY